MIAQDKASSENFRMPKAAIDADEVNFVLPLKEIAPTLVRLVMPENTSAQLLTHSTTKSAWDWALKRKMQAKLVLLFLIP